MVIRVSQKRNNNSVPSQPVQRGQKSCCSWSPLSFICCQTSKGDLCCMGSQESQPLALFCFPVGLQQHLGTPNSGASLSSLAANISGSKHLCQAPEAFPPRPMDSQSSVSLQFNNSITEQNQGIVSSNSTRGKGRNVTAICVPAILMPDA